MKKYLALLLAIVICFAFAACGGEKAPAEGETTTSAVEETTAAEETSDITELGIGDKIENDYFKMTFKSIEIADEFKYKTSEHSTTSLYVEEGYKLLLLKGHIENVGTQKISDNAFSFTATVNDTFVVDGYDVRLNFLRNRSFELDPYTDLDYVIYINIPEKLAEQYDHAIFTIGFNDDMSAPTTVFNSDGTKTVEIDNNYSISSEKGVKTDSKEEVNDEKVTEKVTEKPKAKKIKIGEKIEGKNYDIVVKKVEFTYELLPSDVSSVYSSYPADSGKVYIHVEADVKNTMKRDIRIDELFTASALYDKDYEYSGFTVVDDGNRFDWVSSYSAATPLETCKAHSLIEVPVEVEESGKSVVVSVKIDDEDYKYTLVK